MIKKIETCKYGHTWSPTTHKKCHTCNRLSVKKSYDKDSTKTKARAATWAKDNRQKRNQQIKDWKAKNPKSNWKVRLKYKYGITPEDYQIIFNKQKGKCGICKKQQSELRLPLCIDHCHNTTVIRGLLCISCNFGLGQFQDSVDNLTSAIEYLNNCRQKV